ncbi:conserved hypothetical protein [Massilia sp. 9I]|nr:conserved hypothetical protein [Massilia sp. 9I]
MFVWIVGAILLAPAVIAISACGVFMFRYMRLRRGRKNTLVDHLHDFAGTWTRLFTRRDPAEERAYLRKSLYAGLLFVGYVHILIAITSNS